MDLEMMSDVHCKRSVFQRWSFPMMARSESLQILPSQEACNGREINQPMRFFAVLRFSLLFMKKGMLEIYRR